MTDPSPDDLDPLDPSDEGDPLDPDPRAQPTPADARAEAPPQGEAPLDEEEEGRARGVSDMLRKAMVAGLGAVFMTEEGIRTLVKDLKLPKDVVGYVVGQAERSKGELFRVISEELRRFFESAALRREFTNLLSDVTIEVKAEIRIRPEGQGGTQVKVATTEVRRSKRKKKRS